MPGITEFIRRLPKAELHLHLEGTILPSTLLELSARHDAHPMSPAEAESHYRFDDFTSFIEGFKAVTRRLIDPGDYELVAAGRAGRGARRGLHLCRRHLHVAEFRSAGA
jgi:aminodeoxyfutalosine deaminase